MKQFSINNILIIEDNPNDVELIKEYLKVASFKYRTFHSASLIGGIELIEDKSIDLVLLDLSLDDTKGFNTLTEYLDKSEDIPVIVLTGNKNEAVGIRSVSAGAQDFLVKGEFDEQRLVNAIKYSIQRFKSQAKLKEKNQILAIREKRYREAQKIGSYTNWEMNIVNNEMKWSNEMFEIFGFPHQSFSPTLSDYLRYVHIEDKESVESFFENTIKTGELTKLNHRILVQGRQVKTLNIRAQVKYDETTNTIILFGNLQDITENAPASIKNLEAEEKAEASEINLKYSAALPKNFDFFNHLINLTDQLGELFDSGLSPKQFEILSSMAVAMGNYTKMTGNFQNLLPMLEQRKHLKEIEFNLDTLLEDVKAPFKLQKTLDRTFVNIKVDDDFTGNYVGAMSDIRLTIFNIILNILQVNKNKDDINLYARKFRDKKLFFEFRFEFKPHLLIAKTLIELIEGENVFELRNLKNLFRVHPIDLVVSANMIYRLKGKLNYEANDKGSNIFTLTIPVKEIEKKIINGKIVSTVNILLAEDHVMNKIVLKKTLKAWSDKINIKEVNTGEQILSRINQDSYDLVMLNVDLPDSSGMENNRTNKEKTGYPCSRNQLLPFQPGKTTLP
jgi:DNA-binding response OmpR family regulator